MVCYIWILHLSGILSSLVTGICLSPRISNVLTSNKFKVVTAKTSLVFIILQMFVRLFVDENLDRMIPISKQPKEKVQAILEACDRQFLEFRERSRKRIRTYLKSCRRLKKKDANGQEIVSFVLFYLIIIINLHSKISVGL